MSAPRRRSRAIPAATLNGEVARQRELETHRRAERRAPLLAALASRRGHSSVDDRRARYPLRRARTTGPGTSAAIRELRRPSEMREINGTATAVVPASLEAVLELLGAVERYPEWHPDVVRSVEVLESDSDDRPLTVQTKLHVSTGPFSHDFNLTMDVDVDARGTVKLSKVKSKDSDQQFDVVWRLRKDDGTRIELDLAASLDVSRFLPLGSVGDSLAEGFVAAAVDALA